MKYFFLILIFSVFAFFGFRQVRESVKSDLTEPVSLPSVTPTPNNQKRIKSVKSAAVARSIFVPYWALSDAELDKDTYREFFYFGITPQVTGLNKKEAGFANLEKFNKAVPDGSRKKLVLRMLDGENTFPILKDPVKQKRLMKETIAAAKEEEFDGIVLDLEIAAVPFESLVAQITQFTRLFYEETKNNNLTFTLMFYGDTFYRIRPFDVKELSKNADEFLIMSYDFHKSRGNPGPNFPLRGKEVYGYDMTRMADDFLRYLPPERTGVVFGLYGYDWVVDEKGTAVGTGEAKSYQKIKQDFLGKCKYKECDIKRKNDSRETEIRYTDNEGRKHVVWFDDMESIKAKEEYLRGRGIGTFSYWAYSYF
jgi:spore germination protein